MRIINCKICHLTLHVLIVILFMYSPSLYAVPHQSVASIKGKVTDMTGFPMPGVTVIEEGTTSATITDADGNYTINIKSPKAVLRFSFMGMKTLEEEVKNRRIINVMMQEDSKDLDEVVVIGYGTVKKSDLTGSVSSIKGDAVNNRIVSSLDEAMRGKAAGVQITQNDGAPGSDFTIRIRGASSVNASSAPIYVVDGVIMEDATNLNPGDVESIEILKDASGTAIYGSRGANGVIMVTTKRGQEGKPRVNLYANFGWQSPANQYSMMDSREYAKMRYQTTGWSYYKYGSLPGNLTDAAVYRDGTESDANYWVLSTNNSFQNWQSYADSTNTDWQDVMFRTALVQEYRVNVSGGTANSKYSVMGGYLNQDGIVINSGYERFSGRLNWENKLTSKLKLTTNISVSRTTYDGIATGPSDGVISNMLKQKPITAFDRNSIEEENESSLISNPYIQAKNITKDRFRNNLVARMVLDYAISKEFQFKATGTYVNNNNKDKTFYPANVSQGFKSNGRGFITDTENTKLIGEAFLTYIKRFKKSHRIKIMAGSILEKYRNESLTTENQDFPETNLGANGMQLGINPQIPVSAMNGYQMASFLGRAEYSYKDRYLLTGTLRADGSSRFGADNRWAVFPSIALAWRISEENFIKNLDVFSNMKLRLSYGSSGNTAIPAYRSLSTINTAFNPMDGTNISYGTYVNTISNPDLKWETTDQFDFGLDFGFFDNRLNLTIDGYLKKTKDLLLEKNTPLYSGYRKTWANIGSIENKGLEITLGGVLINTRDWNWAMDFNIAFNRSKVLDIGPGGEMGFDPGVIPGSGNFVMIKEGESLGQWYGYKVDGVYKSQAEINEHEITEVLGRQKSTLRPGDHKFVDTNKDGRVDSDDLTCLGRGEPLYTGGLTNSVSYKGFEFSFMLQYSYGAKVFNANLAVLDAGREGYNQTTHLTNSWMPTLYNEAGELVDAGNPNGKYRFPGGPAENYCLSEFIEDGSFLRISDITLAYSFPKKMLRKFKMQELRIFTTAKNIHTFTSYFGFDPEVNTRQGQTGDLMPSLDYGSYPRNKAFSVGLNVTF